MTIQSLDDEQEAALLELPCAIDAGLEKVADLVDVEIAATGRRVT